VAASLPKLAVPGFVIAIVLGLSLPASDRPGLRLLFRVATVIAAAGCVLGLARFAMSGAMLGIVETGQSAAAKSARYRLREVVLAEDAFRKDPVVDTDGDRIGSAVHIGVLMGEEAPRPGAAVRPAFLNRAFHGLVRTREGPAALVERYLVLVCLPKPGGGLSAKPDDAVDDELAERRFVAYAWPSESAAGLSIAFFADEHENIKLLEAKGGAPPAYLGAERPPACDAALGADGEPWTVWKNKKPRTHLPGDR